MASRACVLLRACAGAVSNLYIHTYITHTYKEGPHPCPKARASDIRATTTATSSSRTHIHTYDLVHMDDGSVGYNLGGFIPYLPTTPWTRVCTCVGAAESLHTYIYPLDPTAPPPWTPPVDALGSIDRLPPVSLTLRVEYE